MIHAVISPAATCVKTLKSSFLCLARNDEIAVWNFLSRIFIGHVSHLKKYERSKRIVLPRLAAVKP